MWFVWMSTFLILIWKKSMAILSVPWIFQVRESHNAGCAWKENEGWMVQKKNKKIHTHTSSTRVVCREKNAGAFRFAENAENFVIFPGATHIREVDWNSPSILTDAPTRITLLLYTFIIRACLPTFQPQAQRRILNIYLKHSRKDPPVT